MYGRFSVDEMQVSTCTFHRCNYSTYRTGICNYEMFPTGNFFLSDYVHDSCTTSVEDNEEKCT